MFGRWLGIAADAMTAAPAAPTAVALSGLGGRRGRRARTPQRLEQSGRVDAGRTALGEGGEDLPDGRVASEEAGNHVAGDVNAGDAMHGHVAALVGGL